MDRWISAIASTHLQEPHRLRIKWYYSFMNFIGDFNMLEIHKSIVVDENQKPVAIQIPFDEFQRIEEVIENFGLAELMAEGESDERLAGNAAKEYYESLKASDVAG
jgi:hypothetical protein